MSSNDLDGFFDDLVSNVVGMSNLMPRLKNIDYNSTTNTTTVYGHTNFEELKVNGTNVALQGHNHDSSYAALNHTHTLSDITNYTASSYDDSNCAKLNTAKVRRNVNVWCSYMYGQQTQT